MDIKEVRERIDRLSNKAKWGLGLAVVLIGAPLMWWIAYAMAGAAAAGIATIGAYLVFMAATEAVPVIARKFANWKLAALKAEAERNPIETLQLQQQQLVRQREDIRAQLVAFAGEVGSYKDFLISKAQSGFVDAARQGLVMYQAMSRRLAWREHQFAAFCKSIEERERRIEEASALYDVALAGQRLKALDQGTEQDVLEGILEKVAFKSVSTAVNASLAEMRVSMASDNVPDDFQFNSPTLQLEDNASLSVGDIINVLNKVEVK